MKIGAKNKKELVVMIVLLIIAIPSSIYLVRTLSGGPAASPAQAVAAPKKSSGVVSVRNLDPTPRIDRLEASQKVQYDGGRRNIFRMEEPQVQKATDKTTATAMDLAPHEVHYLPQPIPLKFYGFSSRTGEPKKIFLADGDDIFVAKEGDVINRKYKIVQIMNSAVVIEDLLNNNRQQILAAGA